MSNDDDEFRAIVRTSKVMAIVAAVIYVALIAAIVWAIVMLVTHFTG